MHGALHRRHRRLLSRLADGTTGDLLVAIVNAKGVRSAVRSDDSMTHSGSRLVPAALQRVVLPFVLLIAVMIGLGFLRTRVLADSWPFAREDQLMRTLVAMRTPTWDRVSDIASLAAYTPGLTLAIVTAAGTMRVAFHRWREFLFVGAAMVAQLGVYMLSARVVARDRPPVPELDDFPPMRSFPSGHVAAAVAVYCGAAVVFSMRARRKSVVVIAWMVSLAIVIAVAMSRVYRGMHYPSDVAASLVVGFGCLWILQRAMFADETARGVPQRGVLER